MNQELTDFVQLKKYAGPSLLNITDNIELFLFRMAPSMIDPSNLINKEFVISKKINSVTIKGEKVDIETQNEISIKNLTLLIPNSEDGNLIAVDKNISCQVVLKKGDVEDTITSELDPSLFESVTPQPPELNRRDFHRPIGGETKTVQPTKRVKTKNKKLENSICNESSNLKQDENIALKSLNKIEKKNKKRKRDQSGIYDESSPRLENDFLNDSSVKKKKDKSIELEEVNNPLDTSMVKKKKRRKLEAIDD